MTAVLVFTTDEYLLQIFHEWRFACQGRADDPSRSRIGTFEWKLNEAATELSAECSSVV
jgi:hypothetical protein